MWETVRMTSINSVTEKGACFKKRSGLFEKTQSYKGSRPFMKGVCSVIQQQSESVTLAAELPLVSCT